METLAHDARPQTARRAVFRNFFQQVVVRIEEEREAWRKIVDFQSGFQSRFDVSDRISKGEGDLLDRGRAGFANMIAADRNRVPLRHFTRAKRERIGNQSQTRLRWKDVSPARDV